MTIFLKTEDEIELLRRANLLVGKTLSLLSTYIKPGVTTLQLDKVAEEFIRDSGAIPSFKGYPNPYGGPFPASICTSVNDVLVHGIPDKTTVLKDGDIISIDCGILFDGYHGDSCYTFSVGEVSKEVKHLLRTVKDALYKGISKSVAGNHLGDIGHEIDIYCRSNRCNIVRELTGHGIGREMHEDPIVPNYGLEGRGVLLKNGMCLSLEPIATLGSSSFFLMPDRWTVKTLDGSYAAHFEHTIAVRNGYADILSTFEEIERKEDILY